jgi:hypothetical protein
MIRVPGALVLMLLGKGKAKYSDKMFLLFRSQHVSAQIGHRQAMHEKFTNDDGIL